MKMPVNGQYFQNALGLRNLKRPLFFNVSPNATHPTLFRDTFILIQNFYVLNCLVFLIFDIFCTFSI